MTETGNKEWPAGLEKPDEMNARWKKAIAEAGAATEEQMRAAEAPWPKTPDELAQYIASLVDRPHDYGTCVYAMSLAAVAAYNYVASLLGASGFQASCADLDIVRRNRRIKHGFMILEANDLLYPQYDLRAKLEEFIAKNLPELADAAAALLAENGEQGAPAVRAHWKRLAAQKTTSQSR
jgi:hypothetical protein